MVPGETSDKMKFHPIRLITLGVKELFIRSNVPPDVATGADAKDCSVKIGSSPYDPKSKKIAVSLTLESGLDAAPADVPFAMKIELVGIFQVDESEFPIEHISDWASKNAPLILYPYMREHAFGLSSRCGFKPLLLPLLEVPTFRIEKPAKGKKKPK